MKLALMISILIIGRAGGFSTDRCQAVLSGGIS